MKALHYNLNIPNDRTIVVQDEVLDSFYPHFHKHPEYQLVWIAEGDGKLIVDNNLHDFERGEVFLIGANQPHVFKGDKLPLHVRTVSVFFNLKGTLEYIFGLPELKTLKTFLTNFSNGFRVPKEYIKDVSSRIVILKNSDGADRLINFIYLLKLLNVISKDVSPLSGAIIKEINDVASIRIIGLCNYIKQHFREDLHLNTIAEKANLTPQAFCRYFKKCTGKTFVCYLNELRVSEACRLLINERYDCISMIAYNSGFNSITNFNRVFRASTGLSPKEFVHRYETSINQ
ncbi:AraC family transcriptional regulator [Sphingobacterium bovistauri]|uniref:Helix-turn-helix domain-containing protein n=1 Tax=Sphingobacterium bovistauri TaxID=2781959 RepID=A0ABS7Z0W5_9SPHI|nr:AraC family transcriptional regulator [Sphingobacterium bovistauri]MCA5003816.1 helix-turn-helix domain-containing protein [Sphingobacterium bovistauri]